MARCLIGGTVKHPRMSTGGFELIETERGYRRLFYRLGEGWARGVTGHGFPGAARLGVSA